MRCLVFSILIVVLVLALMPWVLSGFQPQALVPEEIRLERTHYAATVTTSQGATAEANRESTSIVRITPLQTLSPTLSPQQNLEGNNTSSSTVVISTITVLDGTLIPTEDVDPAFNTPTLTQAPVTITDSTNDWVIGTPLGLLDVEDIITEDKLMEQFRQDAGEQDLQELEVQLSPEGIRITTFVTIFPGIKQTIEAKGKFLVENTSLLVDIYSILLENQDGTDSYAGQLESRINTSLYNLLPQRFVESVTLYEGEIIVQSKVKP